MTTSVIRKVYEGVEKRAVILSPQTTPVNTDYQSTSLTLKMTKKRETILKKVDDKQQICMMSPQRLVHHVYNAEKCTKHCVLQK